MGRTLPNRAENLLTIAFQAIYYGMQISEKHSINRVKRAMFYADRKHFNNQRAARLYIACRRWLGTW